MIDIKLDDLYPLMIESFNENLKFEFPINGTSMRPLLTKGDSVTIKKIEDVKVGDIILYKRLNGQFILHRLRKIKNESYSFVGDHQTKIEENIKYDMLIGTLISYKHKNKIHNLKSIRYKIYKKMVKIKFIRWLFSKLS